jgi:CubicO group peptidase (beta-lactamase class C family)
MQTHLLLAILTILSTASDSLPTQSPSAPSAQKAVSLAKADSLVSDWVDAERVPGAVLLVIRDGSPVLERAYGWAQLYEYGEGQYGARESERSGRTSEAGIRRLGEPRPMTIETVFDLASVTKVMATTLAIMDLVDRGRLELDAPVHRYLADFTGGGKERITLRHLLTHRSGLEQWLPVYYHASDADAAYAYIRDVPLKWDVGKGRHYSDLGFMLLGRIVEQVSQESLDAYLTARFYGPLGLAATGFRPSSTAGPAAAHRFAATSHGNPYERRMVHDSTFGERRMVHDSTFGYRIEGDPDTWNGWRRYTLVGAVNDGNAYHAFAGVAGHAGLFSSARELGVLLQLVLDRGSHGGRRYLPAEVIDAFLQPAGEGQALGWRIPAYAPAGSFSHTGFTGTFVLGVPERRLGIVLLTNRQNVGIDERGYYPDVRPLRRAVARALLETGKP